MRSTKLATIAMTGLLGLTLTGCGSDAVDATTPGVDALVDPSPVAELDTLTGVDTAVALDQGFLDGLTALNVTPGVSGTATLESGVLTFPITGGNVTIYEPGAIDPYVVGEIDHDGSGLSLEAGGTTVDLESFVIDPGDSVLTGKVTAGGEVVTDSANLFFLDGSTLEDVTMEDGNAVLQGTTVKLHPDAAALLRDTFGVTEDQLPDFFTVGTATITATG